MSDTVITALMPLKNYHPEYLEKSVESITAQSCPDWRLTIIVERDDLDKFREILRGELSDPRVEMIVNEGRKMAGALNSGMKRAKTDFAAILLADDMWANDAVETLSRYIARHPGIDFFHSSRVIVDGNGSPISSVYLSKDDFSLDDFKSGSPVKHLLCWRKEKALSIGGIDESLNSVGPDDYDFPWTMAENGAKFKAVEECLYLYRDHRDCFRLTTHLPLSMHKKEIRRIMKKHGVDTHTIKKQIAEAEESYLQQCLYKTAADQRIKEKLGHDPRHGWREKYK